MRRKVMFDSSCVYAVVSPHLDPNLAAQLPGEGHDCKYYTGPYLRMEFLRVWIITGIQIYFHARCTNDLAQTFHYFSNAFGREPKIALHWAARYMKSLETEDVTECVGQFGWLVMDLALTYDAIFKTYVQQKTGCMRGIIKIDSHQETMKQVLGAFYRHFKTEEHRCNLESLLDLKSGCPKLRKVLKADSQRLPSAQKKHLANYKIGYVTSLLSPGN